MLKINILRKGVTHLRRSVKVIILMILASIIIIGIMSIFFKLTYAVTLNGEEIGYTQDKTELQSRINTYIQSGDGENVAFITVNNMPEYHLCLIKKDITTNDEEIYNSIVSQGQSYYRYYAILENDEEKYCLSTFSDAEEVIKELKSKSSTNAEDLTVVERYSETEATYTEVNDCVTGLYKAKVVKTVTSSGGSAVASTGSNTSSKVVNLGITLIRPTTGTISSRFGLRSRDFHKGLDIAASSGTPIYAAAAGTVTVSAYGYNGGYGNYVIISHGNGVQTVYGHCSSLCVSVGETVSQGQLIARVGTSGNSTGNHLHFEVRVNGIVQNPQNYVY